MKINKDKTALISGASIAGLSTAWWLNHIGYQVTVVELASAPRTNGAAVDLNEATVAITKRMGLYEKLKAHQLGVDRVEYKNIDDVTEGIISVSEGEHSRNEEIEIERDKFVDVLIADLKGQVEFIFNDSVVELRETENEIQAIFKHNAPLTFDLVFGCDGAHSGIRKLWFGPERDYSQFMGAYFSISIIPTLLVPQRIMQTFSVPYKTIMLNGYNGKTDVIFIFLSDDDIVYDYRDIAGQRRIIEEQFKGQGWRTEELLQEVDSSGSFYFDKFCQIKMPAWSKGRVTLIGDAGYCPSPASGQGGSLAIEGAAAVADALVKYNDDHESAFKYYEETLRPEIERVQLIAEENVKTNFVLRNTEEISKRNREAKSF